MYADNHHIDITFIHRLLGFSPMRLKRALVLGLKSLWVHRLRSLLTVLGIVFGVCSVISMLAIGEGLSFEVQERIRQLGSSNIIIRSVKPPEEQAVSTERSFVVEYGITYNDVQRIKSTIPGIEVVVPQRIIRNNVWNASRRVDCDIKGTMPWYPEVSNLSILKGRFFSEDELDTKRNVCVIEEGMANQLFPIDDPIGRDVRVDSSYYRVIGVAAAKREAVKKPDQITDGESKGAPNSMYIPLSAAKSRFGETIVKMSSGNISAEVVELHEATIQVIRQEDVLDTSLIIGDILAAKHKKHDYDIIVPLKLLQQAEETKRLFNIVLGSVAAISLLVGGIGIMNIMLATVTERTREIGIRRALGAKRRDIVFQFLIETVLLSGTGGVIGVALGLAIPILITHFAEMKTIITFWSPLIAFSISAIIGVVFGIYPALRAANMDPVDALRHE